MGIISMYASVKTGVSYEDCAFYHQFDFLGVPEDVFDGWDLRGREADYLGHYDFAGKRVLEFGPASGALTFWMEKQGADVVAVDLSPDSTKHPLDVLWTRGRDRKATLDAMSKFIARVNNSWWFAREQLGGRAKMYHSTVYRVPPAIGPFDVVTFGSILLHLRDPLGAIDSGLKFKPKTIIITDRAPHNLSQEDMDKPIAVFRGSAASVSEIGGLTWWHCTPRLYISFLKARGYMPKYVETKTFRYRKDIDLFTIVAECG